MLADHVHDNRTQGIDHGDSPKSRCFIFVLFEEMESRHSRLQVKLRLRR